jgi:RimJ/RimL family protein N-acetyltransferase
MIKLRKLRISDSIAMLDFINDIETKRNTNFLNYSNSIEDFQDFIKHSLYSKKHIHFAIDYNGYYGGTVSLKNVNKVSKKAEFAIIVLPKYRGFGLGTLALQLIEKYAKSIGLNLIYLNVFSDNLKAITIYEKAGLVKYFSSFRRNDFQNKIKKLIWMKKSL